MKRKPREGFHWRERSSTGKRQRLRSDVDEQGLLNAALRVWFSKNNITPEPSVWNQRGAIQ